MGPGYELLTQSYAPPHGQVFGTETQCLRYYERWAKRFPTLFLRSYKTANPRYLGLPLHGRPCRQTS